MVSIANRNSTEEKQFDLKKRVIIDNIMGKHKSVVILCLTYLIVHYNCVPLHLFVSLVSEKDSSRSSRIQLLTQSDNIQFYGGEQQRADVVATFGKSLPRMSIAIHRKRINNFSSSIMTRISDQSQWLSRPVNSDGG